MASPPKTGVPSPPTGSAQQSRTGKSHFLQNVQLFSRMSYEDCDAIVRHLKRRDFPPGHPIVREGQAGDSMFFLTAGKVEVRKRDVTTGIEFQVAEMEPGHCFGEMALLTGKPRTASVMATEPTTVGILEKKDFEKLLVEHPKIGLSLTTILADRLEKANESVGVGFTSLSKPQFDSRVIGLLPEQAIRQHKVLPISYAGNRLTLAMVDPNNLLALDDVRRFLKGVMIEPVACSDAEFEKFMLTRYETLMKKEESRQQKAKADSPAGVSAMAEGKSAEEMEQDISSGGDAQATLSSLEMESLSDIDLEEIETEAPEATATELRNSAEDAPVVRLANSILALAVKRGASDIHLEPQEKAMVVRFRIDGLLEEVQRLPKKVQMGLVSRFKILSRLDIAEKRLPQDGRISVKLEEKPIDFRVSTIPCKWGEKVCMRILDKSNTTMGLDKLVTDKETLEKIREMVHQPYGIMYVTGPTGSGKTTTLYSALSELNDPDTNISTAEDPIEYDLAGINQVQMHSNIGLDFARTLRAFLRQDPDVILVGETRDLETGKTAVEAALTGHMVFTTLHTNDAAGTFVRLDEMGIEPFLVSSSTIGIVAQRLARRLCQKCKESYPAEKETLEYLGMPTGKKVTFYKAVGCGECSNGYKGRVGIYEVLRMTGNLRPLIVQRAPTDEIKKVAEKDGMVSLKNYGIKLIRKGLTTVDEVLQCVVVQE